MKSTQFTQRHFKNPKKRNLFLSKKKSKYIAPTGLLLSAFALFTSTLLGFGGFSMQAFSGYVIVEFVSNLQMTFLILVGLGLIISGIGYVNQAEKQRIEKSHIILLFHFAVCTVFFITAIFGLTSRFGITDFRGPTTFEEIQGTLLFNNLTLICFLALGTLQVILSVIFFKTEMLQKHQLSKATKTLTVISGILLIIKTVIDYPLIKEAIFIISYALKIPFLNNLLSIVAPLIYIFAQITVAIILFDNQQSMTSQ